MTKEEVLRSFLADPLFIEQCILKPGEADKIRWSDDKNNDFIKVIKIAIEGEVSKESKTVTARKINQLLG
ncbi:hypothetical protein ACFSKU_19175 [Pontibacter silvestris]|uniref:Uncharacterized protein n=1 Tax=Pontibacter silvestris TaxID=2305183 RepID=A0ABW4X235_9BACT|nr:hypothetical protein [Pontibacter silvestris]MCC9134986.1 hypothetical protein [Pontibacter silvestris]